MSQAGGARPGALGRSPSGAAGRPGPRAQPGASAAAVLSALQDAPRCGSLSRPLSGPRPAPSAAGFPLTRTWGLQQPRVGARGRRTGGAGLGRERRKEEGGDCGAHGQRLRGGPPVITAIVTSPPATPMHGAGAGPWVSPGRDVPAEPGPGPRLVPSRTPAPTRDAPSPGRVSLNTGNLGRPKSKSARFIQESSAERFLRVGGGSRGVSQESNNRSSYCGSLRRCAVSTPGLAHTCPFLAYVWSH